MSNKSTASSRGSRRSSNGRSSSNERNNQNDGHRNRSPSPTEFFREQHQIQNKLFKREFELQQFIQQGIMKFLDKQAVRDLIYAYDNEDIFINGEKEFFENVFNDDEDGGENSKRKDKLQLLKHQHSKFFKLINQVNLSQENKLKEFNKNNQQNSMDYELGQQQQNRSQSQNWNLTWFLTTVWVQLFNVKSRNKIHERRDSHILDDLLQKQQQQQQIDNDKQQHNQQQLKNSNKNLKIPSPF